MKKEHVIIAILIFLLAIAIGFITYIFLLNGVKQGQEDAFSSGVQVGYQTAVTDLLEQLPSCQAVPVYYGNQTKYVVDVECLQQVPNK